MTSELNDGCATVNGLALAVFVHVQALLERATPDGFQYSVISHE